MININICYLFCAIDGEAVVRRREVEKEGQKGKGENLLQSTSDLASDFTCYHRHGADILTTYGALYLESGQGDLPNIILAFIISSTSRGDKVITL